ncbi:hypothetical protein [Azospirillum sp. sgz302134]
MPSNSMTAMHPVGYRAAAGVSFAVIAGRAVLFSEARQALFELNDLAAFAWCRLSEGCVVEDIVRDAVTRGLPAGLARDGVLEALSGGLGLGLLEAVPVAARRQRVMVGDVCVDIRYSSDSLAESVAGHFRCLEVADARPSRWIEVDERDGANFLRREGQEAQACRPNELVPALRGALTAEGLARGGHAVALHAACLVSGGGALLIGGPPGAGKSTLAVALVGAGFGYDGDDVALLQGDGRVTGIPFAPALKPGSWPLLAELRPDIAGLPVHDRYDGQEVRFLDGMPAAERAPRPVRWIVSLDRRDGAVATLGRRDPIDALRDLVGGAAAPGDRLSVRGFRALGTALATAECCRLTYSELGAAVSLLADMCKRRSR